MQKKFIKTAKETAIVISQTLEKYRNYRYNKLQKKAQRYNRTLSSISQYEYTYYRFAKWQSYL